MKKAPVLPLPVAAKHRMSSDNENILNSVRNPIPTVFFIPAEIPITDFDFFSLFLNKENSTAIPF
jgi:hypothetical protein